MAQVVDSRTQIVNKKICEGDLIITEEGMNLLVYLTASNEKACLNLSSMKYERMLSSLASIKEIIPADKIRYTIVD